MSIHRFANLIICTALAVVAAGQAEAQTPSSEAATALERAISQSGKIVAKEFHELGTISGRVYTDLECSAVIITNPDDPASATKGLKVEAVSRGTGGVQSASCFLDMGEIPALIAALDYMIAASAAFPVADAKYDELEFSTAGNLSVALFESKGEASASVTCGRIRQERCWFKTAADLGRFREMAQLALTILE